MFSSNADPFEPERAYSAFAAQTLLEHAGDFEASARVLKKSQPAATLAAGGQGSAQPGSSTAQGAQHENVPLSDVRNAMELVQDAGGDLRYCHPWKSWLHWQQTHWQADDTGEPMRRAKGTIKRMIEDARAWMDRTNAKLAAWALGQDLQGNPLQDDPQKVLKTIQDEQGVLCTNPRTGALGRSPTPATMSVIL